MRPQHRARAFLSRYGMAPPYAEIAPLTGRILAEMQRGLNGQPSSIAMIPTYVRNAGSPPPGQKVIVIDSGGTNLRCSVAEVGSRSCVLTPVKTCRMPGTDVPLGWDEFIRFVAECILPVADQADTVAVCFSYTMENTPQLDGRVISIDKEVRIVGAEGQYVGACLKKELERHGVCGKRIVVVNDSAAALLGASFYLNKDAYDGFIGQICGTGTNTCCLLPCSKIRKLRSDDPSEIYINLESGAFKGFTPGFFDRRLNDKSALKEELIVEKLIGGGYIGMLTELVLDGAAAEGEIRDATLKKLGSAGRIRTVDVDNWASGGGLEEINEEDAAYIAAIAHALFERAAVYTGAVLTALMVLTGLGSNEKKPVCICAEGSFIEKSRLFLPLLEECLESFGRKELGLHAQIIIGKGTTQTGSALAALLNRPE